jgi:UDP-2,3-diacylglucosamine pyrophosphatase LpxH
VLDILAELDPQAADNVDAVICGHSHQPKIALRIPPALQLKRE